MALLALRVLFITVAAGVGAIWARSDSFRHPMMPYLVFCGALLVAFVVVAADMMIRKKRIEVISAVYFGLLVGVLLSYLLTIAMDPLLDNNQALKTYVSLGSVTVFCYTCISLLLQTKDDFRFVIPYVEFSRDLKGMKPMILDTSSIIDGRLAELADTSILDSQLVMPRFVLLELQSIADSSDKLRRVRGRRGLDILNRLRTSDKLDFVLYDRDLPEFAGQPVDMKLVLLAKHLDGKLVTGDFNLNKVAKLHNVDVIDLNQVAAALRPQYLPGEGFQVRVVKPGEGHDQGIGYLDDGTMVVVEGGRDRLNQTVGVIVTSTLQTQAGRMIFAKFDGPEMRN
ncbi:MAG: PIN/TRAM domain-containing protein [Planctomycetota bacterium]|nr:PIN/TRAM domain-containing protein [Planctomycetota bacterium]